PRGARGAAEPRGLALHERPAPHRVGRRIRRGEPFPRRAGARPRLRYVVAGGPRRRRLLPGVPQPAAGAHRTASPRADPPPLLAGAGSRLPGAPALVLAAPTVVRGGEPRGPDAPLDARGSVAYRGEDRGLRGEPGPAVRLRPRTTTLDRRVARAALKATAHRASSASMSFFISARVPACAASPARSTADG